MDFFLTFFYFGGGRRDDFFRPLPPFRVFGKSMQIELKNTLQISIYWKGKNEAIAIITETAPKNRLTCF